MKVVIRTKSGQLVKARSKYNNVPHDRYVYFYYNLKIDNWDNFINYIKKYKNKGE